MDRERQPLGKRGLAHARFRSEHRIVLAPAQQNMNSPLDFVLAPDERIDLSLGGAIGEVYRKALERARRRKFWRALFVVALALLVLVLALGLARATHLSIVVGADLGDAVRNKIDHV